MPTPSFFNRYPPFPNDLLELPLRRLSYKKLRESDPSESLELFKASIDHGFFLLDLSDGPDGTQLLSDIEAVFDIGRSFFDLDLEEKIKFKVNSGNIGYKPMGVMAFADGTRDLTEICAVGKDSILDPSLGTNVPTVYCDQRRFLKSLIDRLHPVGTTILAHLAVHLGISNKTLAAFHDPLKSSATVLRFIHNPPQSNVLSRQASLVGHTDSGSITILFAALGGLQVLPSGKDDAPANWRWVRPEANCAIINIGDPLVQWTGGILRSSFHRVLYAPGEQASCERYSFGYFLKPADEGSMRRICEGDVIPKVEAEEEEYEASLPDYDHWHRRKTKGIMEGKNNVKTRGGTVPVMKVLRPEAVA